MVKDTTRRLFDGCTRGPSIQEKRERVCDHFVQITLTTCAYAPQAGTHNGRTGLIRADAAGKRHHVYRFDAPVFMPRALFLTSAS